MRRMLTLVSIVIALLATVLMPGRVAAAPVSASAPHWTDCKIHLDWPTATKVVAKECHRYPMPKEHRTMVGHFLLIATRAGHPHYIERVYWPRFETVLPVASLPGCPYSIARWASYIIDASRRTGVAIHMITGIMQTESGGNQFATNPRSGAAGLMQFLPSTAAYFMGGFDPYSPVSIYYGALYYKMYGANAYSGGGYGDATIWANGCD